MGAGYTLSATVTPLGGDRDRDGIADRDDRCRSTAGTTASGCPTPATEWIRVYLDGDLVRVTRLDRIGGVGSFRMAVPARAADTVRIVWANRSGPLASVSRRVG